MHQVQVCIWCRADKRDKGDNEVEVITCPDPPAHLLTESLARFLYPNRLRNLKPVVKLNDQSSATLEFYPKRERSSTGYQH